MNFQLVEGTLSFRPLRYVFGVTEDNTNEIEHFLSTEVAKSIEEVMRSLSTALPELTR